MEYRELGRTGMNVSTVAFGTSPLGDMFGPASAESGIAAVHRALDAGINLFDSSVYYGMGLAEERLGTALAGHRDEVFVSTKAGRFGADVFDYSPARLRASLEESLRLLRTDHVDVFFLHDVEYVDLDPVLTDAFAALQQLKDDGLTRFIGMSGYPMKTLQRVVAETDVDVVLSYSHATLLDQCLTERLVPLAAERGVGIMNAAAVTLGLLTPGPSKIIGGQHPADAEIIAAAERIKAICAEAGVDVAFLANQFSIQRSGCPTTVVGTVKPANLDSAVAAATTPIDEELLARVLAAAAPVARHCWISGRPENN